MTICQHLHFLYRSAIANDRKGDAEIIRECYLMAKKMNKRLVEYNGSNEICGTEDGWLKELDAT